MNNIIDKGNYPCTGCGACSSVCPYVAIDFSYDKRGFYRPIVDEQKCTQCGICKKVCYQFMEEEKPSFDRTYENKKVIAVLNNYMEQMSSVSTVGVATRVAKYFFNKGYNICGVNFDPEKDICEHIIVNKKEDINKTKGSKYLQSSTSKAIKQLMQLSGKSIFFGTPCQIYGLRKIIQRGKIEDNFILVDLFCVGVPTFNLWKRYKEFISRNFGLNTLTNVNFRDKSQGWHKFSFSLDSETEKYCQNLYNDLFYSFYLKKVCLNPSCYNCRFRHSFIYSDIRLGDFWGNKYKIFDDGVELVVLMNSKGEKIWNDIKSAFRYEKCEVNDIFVSQKIDEIPLPDFYNEIIEDLSSEHQLEKIHTKYRINELGYTLKK
jgi:coenzyme F420-reducing hydrogenase beta subunit